MARQGKYQLVFKDHPKYISAHVSGESLSSTDISEYQQKIADEILRSRLTLVMVRRDITLTDTAAELYSLPFLVDPANAVGIRYAFVDKSPVHANTYKLAMLDAEARGITIGIFSDTSAAEEWLCDIARKS